MGSFNLSLNIYNFRRCIIYPKKYFSFQVQDRTYSQTLCEDSVKSNLSLVENDSTTNKTIGHKEYSEREIVHTTEKIPSSIATPKYKDTATYTANFNRTTTFHTKKRERNETPTDKSILNVEQSNNNTPNRTEKLMQDIEQTVNDFVKTLNTFATRDKSHDLNCTSDVPKIPLPKLQGIFDDIIKNYSGNMNPNTSSTENNLDKPDTLLTTNEPNTSTDNSKNQITITNTPNTIIYEPTTEAIMIDKEIPSDVKDCDKNSTIKEIDDDKVSNESTIS